MLEGKFEGDLRVMVFFKIGNEMIGSYGFVEIRIISSLEFPMGILLSYRSRSAFFATHPVHFPRRSLGNGNEIFIND